MCGRVSKLMEGRRRAWRSLAEVATLLRLHKQLDHLQQRHIAWHNSEHMAISNGVLCMQAELAVDGAVHVHCFDSSQSLRGTE